MSEPKASESVGTCVLLTGPHDADILGCRRAVGGPPVSEPKASEPMSTCIRSRAPQSPSPTGAAERWEDCP